MKVLSSENFELHDVTFVLGQDISHLLFFPVVYSKSQKTKNERCAEKTNLGWTLSGFLPKHEIAQTATTFSARDQLKPIS